MIDKADQLGAEVPPDVPCPPWCDPTTPHPWQPDGDEWIRHHEATFAYLGDGAPALGACTVDYFYGGRFERCEPVALVDDYGVTTGDLAALVDRLRATA